MAVLWSLGFTFITIGHFNISPLPSSDGPRHRHRLRHPDLGRYEEELSHGRTVHEAVTIALQHTGIAIITGGSTTAAAFFTLCLSDFVGLAELGTIAGFSMIFCIAAALVVLPAVFLLRDRTRTAGQLVTQSSNSAWNFLHTWDRDLVRNPWLWIILSIILSIAAAASLPKLRFDYNLLDLNNPNAPSVVTLYKVMDASKTSEGTQISTIYASVVADNLDQARELSKKLLALPVVAKVESILELVPPDQTTRSPSCAASSPPRRSSTSSPPPRPKSTSLAPSATSPPSSTRPARPSSRPPPMKASPSSPSRPSPPSAR